MNLFGVTDLHVRVSVNPTEMQIHKQTKSHHQDLNETVLSEFISKIERLKTQTSKPFRERELAAVQFQSF